MPRSFAIICASLFSKPCCCWFEYGKLFGSAHTRSSGGGRATQRAGNQNAAAASALETEDIKQISGLSSWP